MRASWRGVAFVLALSSGCDRRAEPAVSSLASQAAEATNALDAEQWICAARIADAERRPALPGAPAHEQQRITLLGRATGEPVVFSETPPPPLEPTVWKKRESGLVRVMKLRHVYRHSPQGLRAHLLRGGYLYAEDAEEAAMLVKEISLPMLFVEPIVWLMRGSRVYRLERKPARITFKNGTSPRHEYRFADGPLAGATARLLFADRVAVAREALDEPLHRDVRRLRDDVGSERVRVERHIASGMIASLRYGGRWVRALVDADGARLTLACLDAGQEARAHIQAALERSAPRRRAIAALRATVERFIAERLPFDRPYDAEDHYSDGQLRPNWDKAYFEGAPHFSAQGGGYGIFDDDGRPTPPQTCIQMLLESYERAAGTWYRPLGQARERTVGALDFRSFGIVNRSGVLAFEKWARERPELFELLPITERIPFADRARFFGYLARHHERFAAGDIIAIRGIKRDGNIHQHALMIEDVDPITGFPHALVDQRSVPRRHSWEGVMGEAPRRSLYYHARPSALLLSRLDPQRAEP